MSTPTSLRARTLQLFTALRLVREQWAGALVLGIGLGETGQAFAVASLAVGAAGLFLERDPATLRAAQRTGCCTFVITTLDEALRALKNEVRQGRAITIGLSGDPAQWLAEIAERGVLPAVIAAESPLAITPFTAWGTQPLHGLGLAPLAEASLNLNALLDAATAGRWVLDDDVAASMAERRTRDTALIADYGEEDAVAVAMRLWVRTAPSLFPRDTARSVWVRVRT